MDYTQMNKEGWDQRTSVHINSEFYDLTGFVAGKSSLMQPELSLLTDISGKSLLHLQCHFGMDTLSWGRFGAEVTGVDLSSASIDKAEELSREIDIKAEFICSDVLQFSHPQDKEFDIVFTSYGALCWLSDLDKWAKVVAKSLKTGGTFCLVEFHPARELIDGYSYFPVAEPDVYEEGTYTENCEGQKVKLANWSHPVSEVISALIANGIRIDHFNESPYSPYNCFEGMEAVGDKGYTISYKNQEIPLIYSIKGTKV